MYSKRPTFIQHNLPEDFPFNLQPPIKKPEKLSDQSFSCPKSYLLLSISKTPKYYNIESKLESIHKNSIKTRQSEIRIRNISTSNHYLEKLREWDTQKSLRKEELVRKLDVMKKFDNYSPGIKQIFDVDEEDFSYSFLNRKGLVRKLKKNLLDVSVKPNYLAPEGYISMHPYSIYNTPKVNQRSNAFESMEESFKVKKSLASRNISFGLHKINGSLIEKSNKELPKGGEMLMKF